MSDAHFRRTGRRETGLQARYWPTQVRPGAAGRAVGDLLDIGVGGARVRCDGAPPAIGDVLTLRVTAPTAWDPLELSGEVRWVGEEDGHPAFGVMFRGVDTHALQVLHRLLASLPKGPA
jgi:hypothetical protein